MRETTRRKLLEGALKVFLVDPGASIEEVADRSDTSRSTLYRYFPTRSELLRALTEYADEAATEALGPLFRKPLGGAELLREVVRALLPLGDAFRFLWRQGPELMDEWTERTRMENARFWALVVASLRADGLVDPALPDEWVRWTLEGQLYAVWESVAAGEIAPVKAPEFVVRTVTRGIGPIEGERS